MVQHNVVPKTVTRRAIAVSGIVQGVGFRPFVHGLASDLDLRGFVRNAAGGVEIEVEGEVAAIERFLAELSARPPSRARIDVVFAVPCLARGDDDFRIAESSVDVQGAVSVSPDIATCDDCLREMFDPADRRYGYPFISCAQCGPRLTIVRSAPYDRQRTTMSGFGMCGQCRAEYDDPRDRRFHAEAIACSSCGPRLRLLDGAGRLMHCQDPLAEAVTALRSGGIVALKGLGGFHLVCDASDSAAVSQLRRRKVRDEKPFALMARDLDAAGELAEISELERRALTLPAKPIVLLRARSDARVAPAVAPGLAVLGVMLPYTPLHHLILREMPHPVVMTSGNRADEPIVCEDAEASLRLAGVADFVLTHDRRIETRCDDSVARVVGRGISWMRRSRGEAPRGLALRTALARPTLALGGHLKATIALGSGRRVVPSHHLGDLDEYETYRAYVDAIAQYQRLFRIAAERVVRDLHPDYASTRYGIELARETGMEILTVQHHHAHMASCMAEHRLAGPVIGVCFDGAGWGADDTIWGGEFLIGDDGDFRRAAHFSYVGMPGGEAAIREPWRMAVAHLIHAGAAGTAIVRVDVGRLRMVERMLERGFNVPMTSSAGRLFDAVAALAGVCERAGYEGQAAMMLESLALGVRAAGAYPFELATGSDALVIDSRPLIQAVAADVRKGIAPAIIARRFHTTMVEVIVAVCERIRAMEGVDRVVLSGGVFVNAILSGEASDALRRAGFHPYQHVSMPPNDGGLCLGQLAIAAARDASEGGHH
jgi:hydrogenase maturation protein HypF